MGTIGWIVVAVVAALGLLMAFWGKVPAAWKATLPTGVTTTLDTIAFDTTAAAAKAALKTLIWAFVERGDTETANGLAPLSLKISAWTLPAGTTTPTSATVPAKLPDGTTVQVLASSLPATGKILTS